MAYVNVKDWSCEQVVFWIKGLDNCLQQYTKCLQQSNVNGSKLLSLTSSDLECLTITKIGHQELLLESIECLKHLHYELDKENLMYLAMKLSCGANSLNRELRQHDENRRLETKTIKDVANLIDVIKKIILWLDKPPFVEEFPYLEKKASLLSTTLKLIWNAKRDNFAEKPAAEICRLCNQLLEFADEILKKSLDPLVLQPAYLELVTLKKRNDDLGFQIAESYHGIHQITEIKFGSPAHMSGKIDDGDEIVQVNYQTIVGWQLPKVSLLFIESPSDVLLTIKKRPRHCKIFGQIHIKPYRLPNKKRNTNHTKWTQNKQSSHLDFVRVPDFRISSNSKFGPSIKQQQQQQQRDIKSFKSNDNNDSVSDSDSDSDSSIIESSNIFTPLKSRPLLRRRNTIGGYSSKFMLLKSNPKSQKKTQSWSKERHDKSKTNDSFAVLIDKSMSYDFGLEKTDSSGSANNMACTQKNTNSSLDLSKSKSIKVASNMNENATTCKWKNEIIEEIIGSLKKNISIESNLPTAAGTVGDEAITSNSTNVRSISNATVVNANMNVEKSREPSFIKRPKQKPVVPPRTSCSLKPPPIQSVKIDQKNGNHTLYSDSQQPQSIAIPTPIRKVDLVEKFLSNLAIDNKAKEVDLNSNSSSNSKLSASVVSLAEEEIARPILGSNKVSNLRLLSCNNGSTSMKKKNSLKNKRRKVAIKDLVPFEIQGYLFQRPNRSRSSQTTINWKRRFFVLFNNALYGFKDKDAPKAEFLIFLNGFTITLAAEVKSKPFSFKIYHTGKAFYFAADSEDILQIWLQQITNVVHADILKPFDESLISETDDSDSEIRMAKESSSSISNLKEIPSNYALSLRKFGSLKKFASRKSTASDQSSSSSVSESTSLDRKYLKFFHSSSSSSSSSTKSAKNTSLPISSTISNPITTPTSQFRSYRKVLNRSTDQ